MKAKVLLVDDQESILYALSRLLGGLGYEVLTATNIKQALELLPQAEVAIFDLRLDKESGIDLLGQVRASGNSLPVLVLSAYTSPDNLVMATRYGAVDVLRKPVSAEDLSQALAKAVSKISPPDATSKILQQRQAAGVIGSSAVMLEVFKALGLAASNNLSVLLTGETGVGKDVSAKLIHSSSARSEAPFIPVNTTAIPGNLFEAELFGYAQGAFTGAKQAATGLIEAAAGGTLFLDEIGDLPLASQAKLLRFLEDQTFNRLGDAKLRKADVRIIAATNQNLSQRIEEGLFREDLYYRLALVPIEIPPLCERLEDLPDLINEFLLQINQDLNLQITGISQTALDQARNYTWPGNVRELKNTLFRTAAGLQTGLIESLDLDLHLMQSNKSFSSSEDLIKAAIQIAIEENTLIEFAQNFERQLVEQVLEYYEGNRSKAAEALGLARNTLLNRLRSHGLDT